ncbi:outer membrane protein transport protein [Puniceibacterium confluentis]|uniref:outer membrane protein transport protein n=1 Tax=Puniceibacterium confluentis TaxID=1958944 RepID=UPI0011B41D9C|nr:outer membrane protein transport protein [Puniceibacterium confluentis]
MKKILVSASALALAAGSASAAGLDRSGQSVLSIFDADNTATLSFGYVQPSVTGRDALGNKYDVGENYTQTGLTYTNAVNSQFNYSVILDQPYGVNVDYNGNPATSTLAGTGADLRSEAISFVGRYKINDRFSVFGGIKGERVSAEVALNGQAYAQAISTAAVARSFSGSLPAGAPALSPTTLGAALAGSPTAAGTIDTTYGAGTTAALGGAVAGQIGSYFANGGYDFEMEDDSSVGYVVGAAYEIPDIALRLAATYSFEIDHKADTTERLYGTTFKSDVEYVTPQSLNLDFQTGIAAGTLLTASYRWTDFSEVDVIPTTLNSDLVNLEDSHRYTIGLARQFNDQFAGSISFIYEPETGAKTVSPLGPTDGLMGVSLGGRYVNGPMKISAGINYSKLGDADAGVADRSVAKFRDNSAVGIGFKAEMTF